MMKSRIVGFQYQYTLNDGSTGSVYFPANNMADALKLIYRLKELKPIVSGVILTDVRLQSDAETGKQLTLKLVA